MISLKGNIENKYRELSCTIFAKYKSLSKQSLFYTFSKR